MQSIVRPQQVALQPLSAKTGAGSHGQTSHITSESSQGTVRDAVKERQVSAANTTRRRDNKGATKLHHTGK